MKKQNLVIIGNGMAATRLLELLLKQAPDRYEISLFGAEPHPGYNRIMLSPVLADEMASDAIVQHSRDWYQQHNIRFYCGETITRIDRQQRCVYSHSGIYQPYDQLIIATGSEPLQPAALLGNTLSGVFNFRTLHDVARLQQAAASSRHAVVIGGGLLGLEAAHGLRQQGCDVTVLHRGDWLLNRQLDSTAAGLLHETLSDRGIQIRTNCEVTQLNGEHQLESIQLSDGSTLTTDLLVSAIGIQPQASLAREAGLHCQRGIVVDSQLHTSDPNIFALGECSEFEGHTFGLVAPIYDQAQVLADQLSGLQESLFSHRPQATRLKVSGIELFSAGAHLDTPGLQRQQFINRLDGSYRTLLFRDNRLAGAVLYGDTRDGNYYFELIEQQCDISDLRPLLIFGQGLAPQAQPSHTAPTLA